jgi:hypothetical protein
MQLAGHSARCGAWWGEEVSRPPTGASYGVSRGKERGKEKGQLPTELP